MIMAVTFPSVSFARLLGALLFAACLSAAAAQQGAQPSPEERLNGPTAILDRIDAALTREGLSDEELKKLRTEAIDAGSEARAIALAHEPVVSDLKEQLKQLKREPAGGETDTSRQGGLESAPGAKPPADEPAAPAPEATAEAEAGRDAVAEEIARIEAELSAADAIVKRARAIEARAQRQASQIVSILRDHFNQRIFGRVTSFVNPALWMEAGRELPANAASAGQILKGLFTRAVSRGPVALIPLAVLLLALAFVAVARPRRGLIRLVAQLLGQREPSDLGKAVTAVLVAAIVTAVPPVGYWAAIYLARAINAVPPFLTFLIDETGAAVLVMAAAFGFTRAILAPGRREWRIAMIGDMPATYLSRRLPVPVLFVGLGLILEGLSEQASFATSVTLAAVGLVSLFFALALIAVIRRARPMLNEPAVAAGVSAISTGYRLSQLGMALAALVGGVILAALIFGFLPLAWFLSKQVVWIALILAAFALIANLLDALGAAYSKSEAPVPARIAGFSPQRRAQFGIVAIGSVKILAAIAALLLIAAPWGVSSVGLFAEVRSALTTFEVGGLTFSLTGIATAALLLIAGVVLTRALQRWMRTRYLPLTDIDPGLKTSIITATGYLGFIVAVVIAFGSIGIDLSRLALVAGALSVGIGFGLQSIVNNFVSGLILLVERPIKAGDWIIVGTEEGTVKKINVRATELETFDRATVVIPNSDLISGTVKNWVLGGTMGRISIGIGVAYGSDAEEVRKILLGCASSHPQVMSYPEPKVFLTDFGDSALMFRLDACLPDISSGLSVRSDIRFEILKQLSDAGIEIPFPQRDVNLRGTDQIIGLIDKTRHAPDAGED